MLEWITPIVTEYGILGLIAAGTLSGSIVPFPVEPLFYAYQQTGLTDSAIAFFAAFGVLLGSLFNYYAGRMAADYVNLRPATRKILKILFDRYGPIAIAAYNLIPLIPLPITMLAGAAHMNRDKFVAVVYVSIVLRYFLVFELLGGLSNLF